MRWRRSKVMKITVGFALVMQGCLSDEALKIECADRSDCPQGYQCTARVCIDPSADISDTSSDALGDACVSELFCGGSCRDLLTDSEHCGGCDEPCEAGVNETAECRGGTCVRECVGPFFDLDGEPGCEYSCMFESRNDACDGLDNDCDGLVDSGASYVASACSAQTGVCLGSVQPCRGEMEVACDEQSYADHSSSYQPVETWCDELDNDCDGETDEGCCVNPDAAFVTIDDIVGVEFLGVTNDNDALVAVAGESPTLSVHRVELSTDSSFSLSESLLDSLCEDEFSAEESVLDAVSATVLTTCQNESGGRTVTLADPGSGTLTVLGSADQDERVTGWASDVGGTGWYTLTSEDGTRLLQVQLPRGQAEELVTELGFEPSGLALLRASALIVGRMGDVSRSVIVSEIGEVSEVPAASGLELRGDSVPVVHVVGNEGHLGLIESGAGLSVWNVRNPDSVLASVLRVDSIPVEGSSLVVGPVVNEGSRGAWIGAPSGASIDGVAIYDELVISWNASSDDLPAGDPVGLAIIDDVLTLVVQSSPRSLVFLELNDRGQLHCR